MATTKRAKGGTMKTNGAKKSAVKAAAKGKAKAAAKGGAGARTKKKATAARELGKAEVKIRANTIVAIDVPEEVEVIEEPPPSILVPRVRRLSWGYALLAEVGDEAMSDLLVDAGTKVAIEGALDRLAYVYVVQISEDRSVAVLYPPKGGSRRMRPGARMRIPGGSGWITTTKKGKLRTIASTYPLTDDQILALG